MITGILHRSNTISREFDNVFGHCSLDGHAGERIMAAYNQYANAYSNRSDREWYEMTWRELMLLNLANINIDRVMADECERMLDGEFRGRE